MIISSACSGVDEHGFAGGIGVNTARNDVGAGHVEGYFHTSQRPLPSVREAGDDDLLGADQCAVGGLPERELGVGLD